MALKYGFYDAVNHDRQYSARDFSAIFNNIILDGVLPSSGGRNQFAATPKSSGFGVVIDSGWAWFDSTYTWLTSPEAFTLDAADAILYRWDAVVIETDADNRENTIHVVKGTAATEAAYVKPTLSANQHPLCYCKITPGMTAMVQANIENCVGLAACPFITGTVGAADLTQLFAQWEDDFETWFENLQATLSGDVAANLQAEIDDLAGDIADINDIFTPALPVDKGGTGATTAAEARENLGIPDLTGIVRLTADTGTASTKTTWSGSQQHGALYLNNSLVLNVPTDALVVVYVSGSYKANTSTVNYNYFVLADMANQIVLAKDVGADIFAIGNGTITISNSKKLAESDYRITDNSALSYSVRKFSAL